MPCKVSVSLFSQHSLHILLLSSYKMPCVDLIVLGKRELELRFPHNLSQDTFCHEATASHCSGLGCWTVYSKGFAENGGESRLVDLLGVPHFNSRSYFRPAAACSQHSSFGEEGGSSHVRELRLLCVQSLVAGWFGVDFPWGFFRSLSAVFALLSRRCNTTTKTLITVLEIRLLELCWCGVLQQPAGRRNANGKTNVLCL